MIKDWLQNAQDIEHIASSLCAGSPGGVSPGDLVLYVRQQLFDRIQLACTNPDSRVMGWPSASRRLRSFRCMACRRGCACSITSSRGEDPRKSTGT